MLQNVQLLHHLEHRVQVSLLLVTEGYIANSPTAHDPLLICVYSLLRSLLSNADIL